MKPLTRGWISVFLAMLGINLYIWNQYWQIGFIYSKNLKLSIYLLIHLILVGISIYYFCLFFRGKRNNKKSKILGKISGFYISFIGYSLIFYLIYDLFKLTKNIIAYGQDIENLISKIFFGGFLIFFWAGFLAILSLVNSRRFRIKSYRLNLARKNSNLKSLNLGYISDGHIGISLNVDNIDGLVDSLNNLNLDALLLGGDFFDEGTSGWEKIIVVEKLAQVKSKYGIYSIEGNHEYKSDLCDIEMEMNYFKNMGIRVLGDDAICIDGEFYLIGRRDKKSKKIDLSKITRSMNRNLPTILLEHRPNFRESIREEKVDLQISGHTHSGQFLPMRLLDFIFPKLRGEYIYGYHKIGRLHHIVSSGVGDWGVPIRLASRREIVNIRLEFN